MERDITSFWADIKKYEETLAKDPRSYCFAPLAEIYRKLGLLDEAISVAKRGCEIHPEYVGGHMALGRAYFEKGMMKESREAIEKAVRITPDNLLAHKLLSQIYMEAGDNAAAGDSLRTVLSLNPGDLEARVALDSLSSPPAAKPAPAPESPTEAGTEVAESEAPFTGSLAEEDSILEDLEIIEELTEEEMEGEWEEAPFGEPEEIPAKGKDPFKTVTLAELYVSQGFLDRAIDIYRELLENAPADAGLKNRLSELKLSREEAQLQESAFPGTETPGVYADQALYLPGEGMDSPAGNGDKVLDTLEKWLENSRRRR